MSSGETKMLRALWIRTTGVFLGIVLLGHIAAAQALPPVSVTVSPLNDAGGVRYIYQVINHSAFPVTSVIIGLNYYGQKPELQTPPAGWSLTGGIPSSSVSSPNGWTAHITPTEDTDLLQLEWDASSPSNAIPPGQRLQGFSILAAQADTTYASVDWTAYVDGAGTNYYTGTLVLQTLICDTPRLSVSLAPTILWPPNHKLVTVNASVSADDENFPNPAVQLLSITSNERLENGDVVAQYGTPAQTFQVKSERKGDEKTGRIYTVTYSATNSCGNSATASKTVVVPHDQGR